MIEFFRDTITGWIYYVYIAVDLLFIFALLGYVFEKKSKINNYNNVDIQVNNPINEPINSNVAFVQDINEGPPLVKNPVQVNNNLNKSNSLQIIENSNNQQLK